MGKDNKMWHYNVGSWNPAGAESVVVCPGCHYCNKMQGVEVGKTRAREGDLNSLKNRDKSGGGGEYGSDEEWRREIVAVNHCVWTCTSPDLIISCLPGIRYLIKEKDKGEIYCDGGSFVFCFYYKKGGQKVLAWHRRLTASSAYFLLAAQSILVVSLHQKSRMSCFLHLLHWKKRMDGKTHTNCIISLMVHSKVKE